MLFGIRETPNETIEVSSFEMLFGRKVRRYLRLVKDKLLNYSSSRSLLTVIHYLDNFKSLFPFLNLPSKQNFLKFMTL